MNTTAVVLTVHPAYVHYLPASIASIDAQSLPFQRKIIIYDAGFETEPPPFQIPSDWTVIVGNWKNPNLARRAAMQYLKDIEWVCYWDADNRMPDIYHQIVFGALSRCDGRVAVCYPNVQEINPDGTFGYTHIMPDPFDYSLAQFKSIADTASFWRVTALIEVGGFNGEQRGHDDYALALEIFRRGWRGQHAGITFNHLWHADSRQRTSEITQSLWTAYSFAFVTLWSGDKESGQRILNWLATAEIPPKCALYWVDNSGGQMSDMLMTAYRVALRKRFAKIIVIDAGSTYQPAAGEPYMHLQRHRHVAHLYNLVLPGITEEIVVTLEDDTLPPMNGMRTLLSNFLPNTNVAVSAGVYRSRHTPHTICASMRKDRWADQPLWENLPDHPFEIGMTGGGFALVYNHVLKHCLPFRCTFEKGKGGIVGWDGNLGLSLTELGFRLVADPRVRCDHLCVPAQLVSSGQGAGCEDDTGYPPYPPQDGAVDTGYG